jgi:non-specific serine/threonine protein kinase
LARLGIRGQACAAAIDTLIASLQAVPPLLVFDNCERVVQACAELVERLLRDCPRLQILATSREWLGVPGELVRHVQPLALPGEAVELFVDRAIAAEPTFRLTPGSSAAVAAICRLLDGIPSAIELAAARTHTMSVAQIAQHLTDPLATIDWSYDVLTESEKTLLRRLAVFSESFTLAAAQTVCTGPELPADQILDLLDHLVSRSLVSTFSDHEVTRFDLLGTLRGYLLARLTAAGEVDALRARHRDWCIALAEHTPSRRVGGHSGRIRLEQVLTPAAATNPLSQREREVAMLVVRGLSNRQIADRLVVTRKTAEAHISHILTKLGLTSRVQIVAWAYGCGFAQLNTSL